MKKTAQAPANIAFIKYWGKTNDELRLPSNNSFSMNLSGALTTTTVEFSSTLDHDIIAFDGDSASQSELARIILHLDRIRAIAHQTLFARVLTKNTFPKGTGVASSASGFAALSVAAAHAIGLSLSEKELSILARTGSGSACRSIPDGYVIWEKGSSTDTSFAHSIAPPDYWDLRDILCIVDSSMKKISTTKGHESVETSPLWKERCAQLPRVTTELMDAFLTKDFSAFGQCMEDECRNMHAVMQTQSPPLYYWTDVTVTIMNAISSWRESGVPVYYTIDAGANVHVICEGKIEEKVLNLLHSLPGIIQIVINKPYIGTRIIDAHLF